MEGYRRFSLSSTFLDTYKGKQPKWGPIGYIVYKRTYARTKEDGTTEEFWETLRRVVEGIFNIQKDHVMRNRLFWDSAKAQRTAQEMYTRMFEFKLLPPGRGMWSCGSEFVKERSAGALFNCGMISTEDIVFRGGEIFEFIMSALMLGVGVGFDTMGAGKLKLKSPKIIEGLFFNIPDSREGWAESVRLVLNGYFNGDPIPVFDYSSIRKAGEAIKGFGGIASGPAPLKLLHKELYDLLSDREGELLSSGDIVDIENLISKAVISGNIRRSAALALGSPFDTEFVNLKLDQKKLYSHRFASNNSVAATVGMNYSGLLPNITNNGEPGIQWLENARKWGRTGEFINDSLVSGTNPCGEIFLEGVGELCNIVETFPANHANKEDYVRTLELAYLYCKTITLTTTEWPRTNAAMLKNRRIGISASGIIQAFTKHGRRELLSWFDEGYKHIRLFDEQYSNWLAIPKSIKVTTVKPSGTISLLCGATPGIHYPEAEYYIRRVRFDKKDPLLETIRQHGYAIEEDSYNKEGVVVEFPVKEDNFQKSKYEVSLWEQMENAAQLQRYWSDNAVSITVTFKKEEEQDLISVLELYEDKLKSVSFLPLGTHGYKQAPYEAITKEEYKRRTKLGKPINFSSVSAEATGENYCDGDSCTI